MASHAAPVYHSTLLDYPIRLTTPWTFTTRKLFAMAFAVPFIGEMGVACANEWMSDLIYAQTHESISQSSESNQFFQVQINQISHS